MWETGIHGFHILDKGCAEIAKEGPRAPNRFLQPPPTTYLTASGASSAGKPNLLARLLVYKGLGFCLRNVPCLQGATPSAS